MSLWFNPSMLSAYTLAKASAINSLMLSVQVAFDKLPDPALIQQNRIGYVVDSGATNALAVAMPITLSSYAAGICLRVKVLNTNTGATTINVDGLGAVPVKRSDGSPLLGAELLAGSVVDLTYDGTVFRLPPVIVALTAGDIATITAGLAANYEPIIASGLGTQYWRGDKVWATLDKAAVGLPNVDNTSDANKPISTAQQTALNLKLDISVAGSTYLPLAGGTLTGSLGVGVAPSVKFHVNSGATDEAVRVQGNASPYMSFYQSATLLGLLQGTTSTFALQANGTRAVTFHTNGSERARIDSSGNLIVGGTTAINAAKVSFIAADGQNQLILSGTTKGIRFSTTATDARMEAVDQTGVASYQKLNIGGATVGIHIGGTEKFGIAADGTATFASRVNFDNDSLLGIYKSLGLPVILLDANDYFLYDRGANSLSFNIANVAMLTVDSTAAKVATAAPGTNTTQIASTAFVAAMGALKADLASPTFTGTPAAPTAAQGTATTQLATTAFVDRLRDIPRVTGALARGSAFATAAGVTINTAGAAGETYSIYNDSAASITLTQGAGVTLRLAGTATTGNRTLPARGFCTIWFNSTTEAIVMGAGVL